MRLEPMNKISEKETSIFSKCTGDVRDCEVMRLAIFLQKTEEHNSEAQNLRSRLANVACKSCIQQYLADVS